MGKQAMGNIAYNEVSSFKLIAKSHIFISAEVMFFFCAVPYIKSHYYL